MKVVGDTPFPFGEEKDVCVGVTMSLALEIDSTNVTPGSLWSALAGLVMDKLAVLADDPYFEGFLLDSVEVLEVCDLYPDLEE